MGSCVVSVLSTPVTSTTSVLGKRAYNPALDLSPVYPENAAGSSPTLASSEPTAFYGVRQCQWRELETRCSRDTRDINTELCALHGAILPVKASENH
jgi:hypothetical protein